MSPTTWSASSVWGRRADLAAGVRLGGDQPQVADPRSGGPSAFRTFRRTSGHTGTTSGRCGLRPRASSRCEVITAAPRDAIVREARMVNSHMTRIAEIENESMAEVGALGLREQVLAEAWQRGLEHSDVGWVLLYAFRRRLEEGLRRRTTLEEGDHPTLAVGFVDHVDLSRTSGSMETDELGRLLGRFEGLASDIITEAGGKVVKLIGGAAMLVFPQPKRLLRPRSSSWMPAPLATSPPPARSCPARSGPGARRRLLRARGQPGEPACGRRASRHRPRR